MHSTPQPQRKRARRETIAQTNVRQRQEHGASAVPQVMTSEEIQAARIRRQQQIDARRQRQRHRIANMPPRAQARLMITDSAASLAAMFCSVGASTERVDTYFVGWMRQLYTHGVTPAWVIRNAAADAKKLKDLAMAAKNQKFPAPKKRRKQRAKQRVGAPNMATLRTANPREIEQWRLALAQYIWQAQQYREQHNQHFTIQLGRWVNGIVWSYISRKHLKKEHRTKRGAPTNDLAVTQFLLQVGPYATGGDRSVSPLAPIQVNGAIQTAMRTGLINLHQRDKSRQCVC